MVSKPVKPFSEMTPAEQETVRQFCYEIAMILRRITGKEKSISPEDLAVQLGDEEETIFREGGN